MKSIAIDGPAGAGKSTIARALAERLGFLYVDTGAIYRTLAYYVSQNEGKPMEELLQKVKIELRREKGEQRMFLFGEDVTEKIRTQEIGEAASKISALPEVRSSLLSLQRRIAEEENVVMDGRDIGTVVLPNADLKLFLTASPRVRAERRKKQLLEKGEDHRIEDILKEIEERDYRDEHRAIAPLKKAEDAVLVDAGEMSLEEELSYLENLVRKAFE